MKIVKSLFYNLVILFIISFIFVSIPSSNALAYTEGPKNAGLGVSIPGPGNAVWENPNNITAPTGIDAATVVLKKGFLVSNYLWGTKYGFNLPPEANITGIAVTINRKSSGNNPSITDDIVRLVTSEGIVGENKAYTVTWPTSMTAVTYGSPTDLWGVTNWTPDVINSDGFGVAVSAVRNNNGNSDRTASVDYMQISVYYSYITSTALDCGAGTPDTIYGVSINCVVTVTGTAGITPTGTVGWTTGGSGTFSSNTCGLTGSAGVATCSVDYTPTVVGTGTHLITATYNGDVNFVSSIDEQNVSVARRSASVSPNSASKTYGADDPTLTGTLAGFLAGDNVTAVYSRVAGENVLGSPYLITATLSPTEVLNNYNITYNTADFTINPKAASVTPNAFSKTYGAADPTLTGTLVGFLVGDNVTASYSRMSGETVSGSPYVISAVLGPTDVLSNYEISYYTADFTITKADPTCVITPYNVAFDGKVYTATGSCMGVQAETLVGLDLSGTTHSGVGEYVDPWSFTDVTGNYNDKQGTIKDVITGLAFWLPIVFK